MLAARAMSASSASSARRHNIRRERSQVVVDSKLQRKAEKEQRKAENVGQPKVKMTPSLCYLLVRKLAPKALIILGSLFIFFGIMLICMGYDAKLHYPEARGWGITLLVLGVIAVPLGIGWRFWRLKHRREKSNNEPEVRFSSQAASVSVPDVKIDKRPTQFDDISPPSHPGATKGRKKKLAPIKNAPPPPLPDIQVSYIETGETRTQTQSFGDM